MYDELHAPIMPLLAEALVEACAAGGTFLDAGCGSGEKLVLLRRAGWPGRLVALDLDPVQLQAARTRDARATLLQADVCALPLRHRSIDLAWCVAVLHALPDPATLLAELRRVVRPGGHVLLVTAELCHVRAIAWPPAVQLRVAHVMAATWPPPGDDLGADIGQRLRCAGFRMVRLRALLLDHPGDAGMRAAPLADWPAVRPLVAPALSLAEREAADRVATDALPELRPVAFVASAR